MRQIRKFVLVACASLLLTSCMPFPPPHISKPHVQVSYVGPKISPDEKTAYFIKVVSQFSTKMEFESQGFHLLPYGEWRERPYLVWSRFFLCRSAGDGQNPVVVAELPPEKFSGGISPAPLAFVVSWKQRRAVMVVDRYHENLSFIDLATGKNEIHTIADPIPRSPTGTWFWNFRYVSLELIEDDAAVLWSIDSGIIGTLDFEGNARMVDLRDYFEPVIGHSPEAEEKMAVIEKNRHEFGSPLWNEQQRVFAIKVQIGNLDTGLRDGRLEVWILNSSLQLIEKLAFDELRPILEAKEKNKPPPDSKYVWIADRLLGVERVYPVYKRTGPKDSLSDWNVNRGPRPMPRDFQLQGHSIEHKRINPKDTASIW